jgi:hypothetical protein
MGVGTRATNAAAIDTSSATGEYSTCPEAFTALAAVLVLSRSHCFEVSADLGQGAAVAESVSPASRFVGCRQPDRHPHNAAAAIQAAAAAGSCPVDVSGKWRIPLEVFDIRGLAIPGNGGVFE